MKRIVMGALVLLPWVAVAADITPLGLKPGLWEVTVNTKMQLPEAVLANMPAQARAAMDARAQNIVVKSCLTKESMSRAMDFNNDPSTTFADVQKFFELLDKRIALRLKEESASGAK